MKTSDKIDAVSLLKTRILLSQIHYNFQQRLTPTLFAISVFKHPVLCSCSAFVSIFSFLLQIPLCKLHISSQSHTRILHQAFLFPLTLRQMQSLATKTDEVFWCPTLTSKRDDFYN